MNSFFRTFLACFLAIFATIFISGILFFSFIFAITLATESTKVEIEKSSMLTITLAERIVETPSSNPLDMIDPTSLEVKKSLVIKDMVTAILAASTDPKISGIYIKLGDIISIGAANMEEIRAAVSQFKTLSSKPVICFAENYLGSAYYFATVADKIYLAPLGNITWQGKGVQVMYYKDLLDKLDIQPQIFRHGEYKSAVEPFINTTMSTANREQLSKLVGSIWGNIVSTVSAARGIDSTLLQSYATNLTVSTASKALELGFVDGVLYSDQVTDQIKELVGEEDSKEPSFISIADYTSGLTKKVSKNKIAVVYAVGDIISGKSIDGVVGSVTFCRDMKIVREDSTVKAVVVRVNSPGGSAQAAEMMWREVKLTQEKKTVIISMGDYAASGGYYISAPGDAILAEPSTITGSIGVFGIMFNLKNTLSNKLGINVESVTTNPNALTMSPFKPVTQREGEVMTEGVEEVYNTFVDRVATGRNLSVQDVEKIAGGRVWSGIDALSLGLIDGIGGLNDAILMAADRAGVLTDFRVSTVTSKKDQLSTLIDMLLISAKTIGVKSNPLSQIEGYDQLMTLIESGAGVHTAMPYIIKVD